MAGGPTTLDVQREAALVSALRAPNMVERERAYEELFERFRRPVFALCLNLLGDRADAEDALQEVFLGVCNGLSRFRGEATLSTWIYRIAIRVAFRQKARRPIRTATLESEPVAVGTEDTLVAQERKRDLVSALGHLSADHRAVLALIAVDELSSREVAAVLNIPAGTVWSRLHVARKKLVALLEHGRRRSSE